MKNNVQRNSSRVVARTTRSKSKKKSIEVSNNREKKQSKNDENLKKSKNKENSLKKIKDESRVKQLTTKRKKQSEINNKENPDKIKTRSQLKQENNSKKKEANIKALKSDDMDDDNIKEDSKRKKNTRKIHYNIDEDKHASPKKSSLKSQNIDAEKKSPKKSEKIKNLKKQINEEELPSIGGKKYKSTKRKTSDSKIKIESEEIIENKKNSSSEEEEEEELKKKSKSQDPKSRKVKNKVKIYESDEISKSSKKSPKKQSKKVKKGAENTNIEIIKVEKLKLKDSNLILDCCIHCNNRNVLRAAFLKDKNLLKKCFHALEEISSFNDIYSKEYPVTVFDIALENGDKNFFSEFIKFNNDPKLKDRKAFKPQHKLSYVETGGSTQFTHGGIRTRALNMTRGGKLGNNAFLEDVGFINNWSPNLAVNLMKNSKTDPQIFDFLEAVTTNPLDQNSDQSFKLPNFITYIYIAAEHGNKNIVKHLIKKVAKLQNYGFNDLHHQVLEFKDDNFDIKYKVSIGKKAVGNLEISPMHLACINPCEKVLKKFIELGGDWNINDLQQKKPIHYAAACESPSTLNVLLQMGANVNEFDKFKKTPLMMAARAGRKENVSLLLKNKNIQPNIKIRSGYTALHFAIENGHMDVVKLLIEEGKMNIELPGPERMTPLILAAKYGHEDIINYLIEQGAKTKKKDKFKRTALAIAVKAGHSRITSILLRKGAETELADNSNNYPLHYACAYGWMDIVELLVKAGVCVDTINSWKISCIEIAMLKNHFGIVKYLLNNTSVDVNTKFDRGNTLLIHSMILINDKSEKEVEYLIKVKKADVNQSNIEGIAGLHLLALCNFDNYIERNGLQSLKGGYNYNYKYSNRLNIKEKKEALEVEREIHKTIMKRIITLFIENNADINLKTKNGKTPIQMALEVMNYTFIEEILKYNPDLLFQDNKNECILHLLGKFLFNEIGDKLIKSILHLLLRIDCKSIANIINYQGFTPIVNFFVIYEEKIYSYFNEVKKEIEFKYKESIFERTEVNIINKSSQIKSKPGILIDYQDDDKVDISVDDKFHIEEDESNEDEESYDNIDEEEIIITQKPDPLIKNIKKAVPISSKNIKTLSREDKISNICLKESDHEIIKSQTISFMNKYLNETFIIFIKDFITLGCDPRMKVEKLRKYRLKTDGENYNDEDVEIEKNQINSGNKNPRKTGLIKSYNSFGNNNNSSLFGNINQRKMAKQTETKQTETKPLKHKEEDEYPKGYATKSILHLFSGFPFQSLLNYFIDELKMDIQVLDYHNNNMLLSIINNYSKIKQIDENVFSYCFNHLVKNHININQKDSKGNTAIMLCSQNWATQYMITLANFGANINTMNNSGENSLIWYIKKKNKANVDYLLKNFNINVNEINKDGRNALHFVSNEEDTSADIDLSIKIMILHRNADVNARDHFGRTPLHYLFIKFRKDFDYSPIDPIVSLDNFLSLPEIEIDVADIFGNSPLHYCSQRGASISAMSLIKKGANINLKNKEGNTPLAYSLIFKQVNSSIILMQHKSLINDLAFPLTSRKNTSDKKETSKSIHSEKSDINCNQNNRINSNDYSHSNDNELTEEENDEQSENEDNSHSYNNSSQRNKIREEDIINKGIFLSDEEKKFGISLFRICVKFGYQGLTFLFINSGYDLMNGIQDSFYEKKFNLAMLLLNKDLNKETYRALNEKRQNLFHILANHGMGLNSEDLDVFYQQLYLKGISLELEDVFGYTPFHYACENHFISLCEYILKLSNPQLIMNLKSKEGFSPFNCAIKGKRMQNCNHTIDLLLKYNFQNHISETYLEELYGKGYYCTPLIHATRYFLEHGSANSSSSDILSSDLGKIIIKLLSNGSSLREKDSEGLDCIMHCIRFNNLNLIEIFINNYVNDIKFNAVDNKGFSVIHYCICPMEEGSYENKKLLTLLINSGFPLDIKDNYGKMPIDYAIYQKTGLNLNILQKAKPEYSNISIVDQNDGIMNVDWICLGTNYESDADDFYKLKSIQHEKQIELQVTPDPAGQFPKDTHKLVKDIHGEPYDLTMTKVNLTNGIYGEYMFYKMQVIHDQGRDVFILWNRWGRIGEDGASQRTPFNSFDESTAEFKKIFKSKTGNNWDERSNFEQKQGKYLLLKFKSTKANHSDFLQPFDFKQCPESTLSSEIKDILKELANNAIYFKALKDSGIDTEMLNLTYLNKELLLSATKFLGEIKSALEEMDLLSKKALNERRILKDNEVTNVLKLKNKVIDFSNRYYECVPKTEFKNSAICPIDNTSALNKEIMLLDSLQYVENAVKVLLAALYRQKQIHPFDYILDAVNTKLMHLPNESNEYKLIYKYIDNSKSSNVKVKNLFKVYRKGDIDAIEKWSKTSNHYLLFHGTKVFNYIGILSQGLKISPPEAPSTGLMFGKGVYFADMFEKSFGYCDYYEYEDENHMSKNKRHIYMMICEVVLGKMFVPGKGNEGSEEFDYDLGFLKKGYNSTKPYSSRGPDLNNSFVMNNGLTIPIGKIINYDSEKNSKYSVNHPEYIVYDTSQIRIRYLIQLEEN